MQAKLVMLIIFISCRKHSGKLHTLQQVICLYRILYLVAQVHTREAFRLHIGHTTIHYMIYRDDACMNVHHLLSCKLSSQLVFVTHELEELRKEVVER